MKKKELIFSILCLLFYFSLFFSYAGAAKVFLMGLLIISSLTLHPIAEKKKLLQQRQYLWWMFAFGAYLLISTFLLSSNQQDSVRALEKRLPLLFFPIGLGLVQIRKELRDKLLLGFAIITTLCCLTSLGYAIYQYRRLDNTAWLYNDAVSFLIDQQSIYTSLLVNISFYIFGYFLFHASHTVRQKILLGCGMVVLFIISYMLASRNMMFVLYGSIIVFVASYIIQQKKYFAGIMVLIAVGLVLTSVYIFFPKTLNRFKELTYTHFNYSSTATESHYAGDLTADQWNGANFRLAAWPCGWQLFKEHPVLGVGLGDKKNELYAVYQEKNFQFAIKTEKNVHNNYLDILFSLGLVGFILFAAGWIVLPLVYLYRSRDLLGFLVLFTFLFAFITENYFDRSLGGMLFAFFIPFMLTIYRRHQ